MLKIRGDGESTEDTVMVVVGSIKRLFFKSTVKPNFAKKSAPMIGLLTDATMNACRNSRRSPKFNGSSLDPYVLIEEPFNKIFER